MAGFAVSLREQDISTLMAYINPDRDQWRSWIVQALPACGGKIVFTRLGDIIRQRALGDSGITLIELDLANYWVSPIETLVKHVMYQLLGVSRVVDNLV